MKRLVVLAIVCALGAQARANGRFPASTSVNFRAQSSEMYLGVTFGLLVSRDDGAHWWWTCEQNVGYEGTFDPKYAIDAEGTIYATTFDGLRVSRDGGCSFETALDIWVDAIDLGSDGTVWVGTAESGLPNAIYKTTDHGRTVQKVGLESKTIWWKSIRVAPSDARTIYVSGYQVGPTVAVFVNRSTDGGATWEAMPTAGIQLGSRPLVLVDGVDPTDPRIVYARSIKATVSNGDTLYRSADGGATWTEVLASPKPIGGVAVRASGDVVVGTVDNPDPDSEKGCIYRSTDRGVTFGGCELGPQVACLGERGDGQLFGCGANWEPDFFALGRSADAAAWSKIVRFSDMAGPLACPRGSTQKDVCEKTYWPAIATQFGVAGGADAGVEPQGDGGGGCCDSGGAAGVGIVVLALLVGGLLVRRRRRACCR
jgi:hypothetical protein